MDPDTTSVLILAIITEAVRPGIVKSLCIGRILKGLPSKSILFAEIVYHVMRESYVSSYVFVNPNYFICFCENGCRCNVAVF